MSTTIVHAEGEGSIAIGGDAINSIFVTGGVNQFFVGRYERLAEAYLNPRALYRELQLDSFTGRGWLEADLDAFLAENDRGYLIIEAEAGMGKTAFMAWTARKRGYVHHFVRLMPDATDLGIALRSLTAQLIRAWDLQALAVGGMLPANASRPDYFEEVLYEAADKRDATRPGEPIVMIVDGLNETIAPPGQNPLALPVELPQGVYVVVTQRTVHVPLTVLTPRRVLRIRPDSPENMADMCAYLTAVVAEPALARRIAEAGVAPADLVHQLALRSAGVWLVLRYVLAELRGGMRAPDDLTSLPVGLWHYYARFWSEWQRAHEATWASVDLPFLVTLTAVQEPMTLQSLCTLSGCPDPGRAAALVGDAWRPFLQVDEGEEESFAAFHDSLGEFVAGQIDPSALTSAERPFVDRLSRAQRAAHHKIADHYLTTWGGLAAGLPGLRAGTGRPDQLDGGYGLRHVVHHLAAAEADPVMHELLALTWGHAETGAPANAWYEAHRTRRSFAGYVLDVRRAWDRATLVGLLALELRYALITATVNSIAGNVPSDLLVLLTENGLATPGQALELAREITDPRTRAEALTVLLPHLSGDTRAEAVREALASVQLVPDGYWRAGELVRLAPVAGPDYSADLERIAEAISRPYENDITRRFLALDQDAPEASDEEFSFDPVDPRVFATQYLQRTRRGLSTLQLGMNAEPSSAANLLDDASFVKDPRWLAELLTATARSARPETRTELLLAALNRSFLVGDRTALDTARAAAACTLAEYGDVQDALGCLSGLSDPETLADALFTIAASAPHAERPAVLRRAVAAATSVPDPAAKARTLHQHAAQLPADTLPALLDTLPEQERRRVLAARTDPPAELAVTGEAAALAEAIPRLGPDALEPVVPRLQALTDPERQGEVIGLLAARLAELGEARAAVDLLEQPSAFDDDHWSQQARYAVARALAARGETDLATTVAEHITAPQQRAEVLALAGRRSAAFEAADRAQAGEERIAVLLRIAAVAPDGDRDPVEEARREVAGVGDPVTLGPFVNAVSLALATTGRTAEALLAVGLLPDHKRADALVPLAPHLADVVPQALNLARALRDPADRARVLAALTAVVVSAADPAGAGRHLREVTQLLAHGTRAALLDAASGLLPALTELAGPQGLLDMVAAIDTVDQWWP
ncbi:hypothetical protein ACFV8Z_44870 [Streptomyces sp. NPDC059837]|uniref:hypothetical protein n=1 Tax=Streptomyces sp. NPDC059837 TaxID=3346968 RepID=UPI00364802CD